MRKVLLGIVVLFGCVALFTQLLFRSLESRKPQPKPLFLLEKPIVKIQQGTYEGTAMRGTDFPQVIEMFLGIPYAQTTAGENRFNPPVKLERSKTRFDATSYGHRCPSSGDKDVPEGEDCLNLNIYRPMERPAKAKLPVAVFFHGGGFNFGAGRSRSMSSMVAWSTKPFIGVSFNYRVGALGFLPSNYMAEQGLLNIGLKDQFMAMQWVKDNIAAFGGDVNDITAMGTSAGAHSVCLLLYDLGAY